VQHPKGFTGVPQIDGCAGYSATPIELFELDLAIDNQLQAGLTQGQCDLDRQLLLAGQAAFESASRTVFSTSRCAVTPNSLRNFRTLMLTTSPFMVPSFGSKPLKSRAGDRSKSRLRSQFKRHRASSPVATGEKDRLAT
jgi:hypothetical protein